MPTRNFGGETDASYASPAAVERPSSIRLYIILAFCSFLAILVVNAAGGGWLRSTAPVEINEESTRLAVSLLAGRGFADPYAMLATGPSAHVAPLYPLTYAAVLAIFGFGHVSWWAIRLLTIAVYAAGLALLPSVAAGCKMPRAVGITAAAALTVVPLPGSCYKWDSLFDGAFLIAATLATLRLGPTSSWKQGVGVGLLWGTGMLFSPVTLPLFLFWIPLLWLTYRLSLRQCFFVAASVGALILPWTIRNYSVFHRFIPIRSNFGLEVSTSNNDCAVPTLVENIQTPCAKRIHPNLSFESADRLRVIGDPAFNDAELKRAKEWVLANPRRFVQLTLIRIRLFWIPLWQSQTAAMRVAGLQISFWSILAAFGALLLKRDSKLTAVLLGLGSVLFSLPYCINQIDFRHRYPALWIQVLLGCYALYRLVGPHLEKRKTASS